VSFVTAARPPPAAAKTTLLRAIAGLARKPDTGKGPRLAGARQITHVAAGTNVKRRRGVPELRAVSASQPSPAMFAFGLKVRRRGPKREIDVAVERALGVSLVQAFGHPRRPADFPALSGWPAAAAWRWRGARSRSSRMWLLFDEGAFRRSIASLARGDARSSCAACSRT